MFYPRDFSLVIHMRVIPNMHRRRGMPEKVIVRYF